MMLIARPLRVERVRLSACCALLSVIGLAASPIAQAADVTPARIAALFRQVHSYRVVMDVKESGANTSALPAGSSYHMDETLLHRSNSVVTYVKIATSTPGPAWRRAWS